jgi:hypothetical protein
MPEQGAAIDRLDLRALRMAGHHQHIGHQAQGR